MNEHDTSFPDDAAFHHLQSRSQSGNPALSFSAQHLSAPSISTFGGSTPFLASESGDVRFQVFDVQRSLGSDGAPRTTVYVGNERDAVTIAVMTT